MSELRRLIRRTFEERVRSRAMPDGLKAALIAHERLGKFFSALEDEMQTAKMQALRPTRREITEIINDFTDEFCRRAEEHCNASRTTD